jgi:hypothetical protein
MNNSRRALGQRRQKNRPMGNGFVRWRPKFAPQSAAGHHHAAGCGKSHGLSLRKAFSRWARRRSSARQPRRANPVQFFGKKPKPPDEPPGRLTENAPPQTGVGPGHAGGVAETARRQLFRQPDTGRPGPIAHRQHERVGDRVGQMADHRHRPIVGVRVKITTRAPTDFQNRAA